MILAMMTRIPALIPRRARILPRGISLTGTMNILTPVSILWKNVPGPVPLARTIGQYASTFQALAWPPSGSLFDGEAGKTVLKKVFEDVSLFQLPMSQKTSVSFMLT